MSSPSKFYFHTSHEQISNILNIMAHDLRGYLVFISANLKLLSRGYYGNMDEGVRDRLEELFKRVTGLTHIYEEWMSRAFSVNDDLEMERESLDLKRDIIDPVLEEFSTEIKDRGIKIDNRLDPITKNQIPIKANKIWLKAVFRNLIKSAIKYGDPGCTIAFRFEDHGTSCQVNVYNSGKPIPEGRRDKLFTKFGGIGIHISAGSHGMGLGLYLIKKTIRKPGGDIRYEAQEHGSNFVLTIPVAISTT